MTNSTLPRAAATRPLVSVHLVHGPCSPGNPNDLCSSFQACVGSASLGFSCTNVGGDSVYVAPVTVTANVTIEDPVNSGTFYWTDYSYSVGDAGPLILSPGQAIAGVSIFKVSVGGCSYVCGLALSVTPGAAGPSDLIRLGNTASGLDYVTVAPPLSCPSCKVGWFK